MARPSLPIRVARWCEAAYALLALVLAAGLPWPPTPATAVASVHWVGSALLAAMLAWRLGRPNRVTWYVAAILSAYVLVVVLASVGRLASAPVQWERDAALLAAVGIAAAVGLSQLVVAVCLYQARELRRVA